MDQKLRKTLLAVLVILTITFSAVMATSCQNNSDDLKTTETLAETRQIPDYGMAMVTIGNTKKLVSGKITTDVNGRSIITDEVTGETYDVIAAQMIEKEPFATATVKDINGQIIIVTGPVLSTSDDGTTVILDPATGTQYVVKTSEVTPLAAKPTTVSEKTDLAASGTNATSGSSTSMPSQSEISTTAATTDQTTSTSVKASASTTTVKPEPTTAMPTTTASTTEDSYELGEGDTISTDPALETAYNGPTTATPTTTAANVAIPMSKSFANDVLAEINRYRTANGLSELAFTSDNIDMVQNYANDLALQKPNLDADFPKMSKLVTSTDGTLAAKQLIGSGSPALLNSGIQYVAICAAQSSQTKDIFLVIAF
jgi:hypothetical protein